MFAETLRLQIGKPSPVLDRARLVSGAVTA